MAKLNRTELRAHLLRSVQLLKTSLTYTAYCSFILTMLFFNFVMETSGEYGGLQQTQLVVSPSVMAPRSLNGRRKLGFQDDLAEAFSGLEFDNPMLKRVLSGALPKTPLSDEALLKYQHNLEQLQRQSGVFSSPERFSQAYEYWIEQLAAMTTKRGVSFYTHRSVARLMVELLKPKAGTSVYDPTVGTGGMLVESARYVEQHGGSPASMQFSGRELAPNIWAICKMNLLAHGLVGASIEQGDTLQSAQAPPGTFDLVLQNLPLSPNTRSGHLANAAFLRHALQALSPQGRAAVLCPASVLQYDHQEFWQSVLNRDWLEAVISLPPRLLQGTSSGAYLFIFNKQKAPERRAQVQFTQVEPNFFPTARHHRLRDATIQNVVQAFDRWQNASTDSRIVSLEQIERQNYRLNVDRYMELAEEPQSFNLTAALNRYRYTVQKREAAVEKLMRSLETLDTLGENLKNGSTPE